MSTETALVTGSSSVNTAGIRQSAELVLESRLVSFGEGWPLLHVAGFSTQLGSSLSSIEDRGVCLLLLAQHTEWTLPSADKFRS